MDLVEDFVQKLKDCRDKTYFEELWKTTGEQCGTHPEPEILDGHSVMSQLGEIPELNRDTNKSLIHQSGITF